MIRKLTVTKSEPRAGVWTDQTITPPDRDWIIENWLPAGCVTLLAGKSGAELSCSLRKTIYSFVG